MRTAIPLVIGAQLGLMVLLWPAVDKQLRPIVDSFQIRRAAVEGHVLSVSGTMFKLRDEGCKFSSVRFYDQNGSQLALKFDDNKADQAANRPRGHQSWGPWRITLAPGTVALSAESVHECWYDWPFKMPAFDSINEVSMKPARSTWFIRTELVPKTSIAKILEDSQ
jgi:hypothetical protein